MPRIVSLIASSTEIICALGCREWLVGRSHECDYPPEIRDLPCCTEVKMPTDGTSYAIDQQVKAIVQEGLSVYRVRAEVLQALRPTVIVTQTQCEVCAVSERDVAAATCQLLDSRPEVVCLHTDALADLWVDIRKVAVALGVPERAETLIGTLQARIQAISEIAQRQPTRPRMAFIEWIDPLMAGGNWMPELITLAGGENLFGVAGKHSPWMTWEQLVAADPELIVVSPCGFDIARTRQEMHLLTDRPGWQQLSAVQAGRVILADGNQYFNRPGPRLVDSLEILAELIHPQVFHFGHEGKGWVVADCQQE